MTYKNDKSASDLEQIVARAKVNLDALDQLRNSATDYSADLAAMQEKSLELIEGLEEIEARIKAENERHRGTTEPTSGTD